MTFEVIVIVILLILLVKQFDLWNRFTQWFNQQAESDSITDALNYKGYIFIVLVGIIFAFITAYFQTEREIDFTSTTLALEQLSMNGEVLAESAVKAQTEAFRNAFSFSEIYWSQFFENAALFIVLPILISLGTVFMHDEMKKAKKELANVTIGRDKQVEVKEDPAEDLIDPIVAEEPSIVEEVELEEENNVEESEETSAE